MNTEFKAIFNKVILFIVFIVFGNIFSQEIEYTFEGEKFIFSSNSDYSSFSYAKQGLFPGGIYRADTLVFPKKTIALFDDDVLLLGDNIIFEEGSGIYSHNNYRQKNVHLYDNGSNGLDANDVHIIGGIIKFDTKSLTIDVSGDNGGYGGCGYNINSIGNGGNGGNGGNVKIRLDRKSSFITPTASILPFDNRYSKSFELSYKKSFGFRIANNGGAPGLDGAILKSRNSHCDRTKSSSNTGVSGSLTYNTYDSSTMSKFELDQYYKEQIIDFLTEEDKDIIKITKGERSEVQKKSNLKVDSDPRYYALVIAMESYIDSLNIQNLKSPKKYAKDLRNVLDDKYKFYSIDTLYNPTKSILNNRLDSLIIKSRSQDNVLIFYSGHGDIHPITKEGYWLLKESIDNDYESYYNLSVFKSKLNALTCQHVLVIADNCYAGALFDSSFKNSNDFFENKNKLKINKNTYESLYRNKSRKAIIAGDLNLVPDQSDFIEALIRKLKFNDEKYYSILSDMYELVLIAVNQNVQSLPKYETFRNMGDRSGEFIFIKK